MHVRNLLPPLLAAALLVSGCGRADGSIEPGAGSPGEDGGDVAAICIEGTVDCEDTVVSEGEPTPPEEGPLDAEAARRDARSLLGQTEEEVLALWGDVRVGRHGDEEMMLTEDWRPGRKTIATEDDGTGTYRVVEVVLELDEGTETITADS